MKNLITVAAAFAVVSLGSLVSAQAGGTATSAPSKYNNQVQAAYVSQVSNHRQAQSADYGITEFSSSSAKSSVSKR